MGGRRGGEVQTNSLKCRPKLKLADIYISNTCTQLNIISINVNSCYKYMPNIFINLNYIVLMTVRVILCSFLVLNISSNTKNTLPSFSKKKIPRQRFLRLIKKY